MGVGTAVHHHTSSPQRRCAPARTHITSGTAKSANYLYIHSAPSRCSHAAPSLTFIKEVPAVLLWSTAVIAGDKAGLGPGSTNRRVFVYTDFPLALPLV